MLDQTELPRYLAKIDRTFGISDLLKLKTDKETIIRYYTESEKAYRVFHSRDGAVHMTLAENQSSRPDSLGQARLIAAQAREISANKILELGCGKGFNLAYIAKVLPNSELVGIDLTPTHVAIAEKKYAGLQNLGFRVGDFQSLPFANDEFDLVFEVEAVCHAQDPQQAFREAHRVLKPGGRMTVFDGFRAAGLLDRPNEIQTAVHLVELTMAVPQFPTLEEWLDLARSVGLVVIRTNDLSDAIMPNLEKFQVLARGFYKYPALSKQMIRLMPPSLVKNSVAGLLLPFTVSSGAQRYHQIVFEKPRTRE
jgi:ubiquinone/menaquinone biosynthesis C-methylase UbiE